jgi:hypothetical protein
MRSRFKRQKRRRIGAWPDDAAPPEDLAQQVQYVGSPEHKDHPGPAGAPRLRSDATPCEASMTRDINRNTEALREGIRRRCVSPIFEGGFPKYVWTWIEGILYEARHINGPRGTYKGYRLEEVEMPQDPEGKLRWDQP